MGAMTATLQLMQGELYIVLAVLTAVPIFYFGSKVWKGNASLTLILGSGLVVVAILTYLFRHHWHVAMGDRSLLFVLLYVWSALGLWFVAGRSTSTFKLFLGLVALAGVLYGVFKYI